MEGFLFGRSLDVAWHVLVSQTTVATLTSTRIDSQHRVYVAMGRETWGHIVARTGRTKISYFVTLSLYNTTGKMVSDDYLDALEKQTKL